MFPLFQNLPFELRLKIWNLTIEPRVVPCQKLSRPRVPALLQLCRESREEGLRHYEIHYWEPNNKLAVYFNAENDILFATSNLPHDMDYAASLLYKNPAISQIQHLAISRDFWDRIFWSFRNPFYNDLWYRIRGNKNLRTITIVWHGLSVLHTDTPKLIEESEYGRPSHAARYSGNYWRRRLGGKGRQEITRDWRLGRWEPKEEPPEWNTPELIFAHVE
jgi:hypothetical protein